MSVFGDATRVLKEALKLSGDVERLSRLCGELGQEMRVHDRRITRLEAQWDTAMRFAAPPLPPRIDR